MLSTTCIKSLGVWIEDHLSFKRHAAGAASAARQAAGWLWSITKKRDASQGTLHHLTITFRIPALLWGSEICWTGARHILDQLRPAYHTIARAITGLPEWTPIPFLLTEAELPPLYFLQNTATQLYGLRLLRNDNHHPCKSQVVRLLKSRPTVTSGTGLQRVSETLGPLIPNSPDMENSGNHDLPLMGPPIIAAVDKEAEASNHQRWLKTLNPTDILVYTDRSKEADGWTASGRPCIQIAEGPSKVLGEGAGHIGSH